MQNGTITKRVPISILSTIDKIKEIYGSKTDVQAFEKLAHFFEGNSTVNYNLYEKLDIKTDKIKELIRLRVKLKHIANIISDEISENLTVEILKNYLISRKIYF